MNTNRILLTAILVALSVACVWAGGPDEQVPTKYEVDLAIASVTTNLATKLPKTGLCNVSAFMENQTCNNGSASILFFGTEVTDARGEWDKTTGLFTAQDSGNYLFTVFLTIEGNAAGVREFELQVNGSNVSPRLYHACAPPSANDIPWTITFVKHLTAGDVARLIFTQNSGSNLLVRASTSYMQITQLTKE